MKKIKKTCHKIALILEYIIGAVLALCLFVGGIGVIGYIVALTVGGETAGKICLWMNDVFYMFLIKTVSVTTLATFAVIYLKGDAKWISPVKVRKKTEQDT